jgi:cytochrome b6-f complex iron-sulfur subunit
MERKEFLSTFGVGLAAICTGCSLASCGSTPKSEDPVPNQNGTGTTGGSSLFTTNLDAEIKNIGEFKVSNGIILVRLAQANVASSFTAVQIACTHQGTPVNYNNAQGVFICPNHGSKFSTTGGVLLGPAATALKQYVVKVTGNTLSVSA